MSQVFGADAVMGPTSVTVPTNTETTVVTGNFLNPPFQNAKAIVSASVVLLTGTGTTAVTVRLRRNPNGENIVVATQNAVTATAAAAETFAMQGADSIPDGRPVQYSLTVQQTGASANGTLFSNCISAILISG